MSKARKGKKGKNLQRNEHERTKERIFLIVEECVYSEKENSPQHTPPEKSSQKISP